MPDITQTCRVSGKKFVITEADQEFYKKVSPVIGGVKYEIPLPTLCPDERRRRRFTHRNERHLYHRKCDLTGKSIISNYSADGGMTVYNNEDWWSDKWSAFDHGREFDFNRPFFEQYHELTLAVPQLALCVWHSENSNYCNYVGNVKDSYLIFGPVYSEKCYYGSPYYSFECMDALVIRECKFCYECTDCRKLYECFYCQDCEGSANLIYCYDLQNCQDCIGCAGLRNKKFCIFNVQHGEEEYKKYRESLNLCDPNVHEILKDELGRLKLEIPHRFMQSKQAENVAGNYIYNCKNASNCYYTDKSEDVKHCVQVVDLKDCYDNNYTEENELCCDYLGSYQNSRLLYSKFCNKVSEALYSDSCFNSHNLFGCIGLRNASFCILNKQYTPEEYFELVPKIIKHMKETGEWGEFFPINISPFKYNESVADEYFSISKEEAAKNKWPWRDSDEKGFYDGPPVEIPMNISDVSDEILKQILTCEEAGDSYRIIPQELKFYRKMGLPIPRRCPNQRHRDRLALRNPQSIWTRHCAKCSCDIKTTYAPDRPEKVYCETCYLGEVY
ncbi:hypothetical protein HOG48_04285 [Candidatus Peregrinibacteria bacterium]|jgi:hypothetical protein|nr:hypothetical protein [Candidatus Peregrinibacteria bacterium]